MIDTRRKWISGLLGAVSLLVCWRRPARGQQAPRGPLCAGAVSDPQGNGIPKLVVQIVEPSGQVTSGDTGAKGDYTLSAPNSGPYLVLFREPQTKTRLLVVGQLTPGTTLALSVTIDPSRKSFLSVYGALQAVEILAAWAATDPKVATTLFQTIGKPELSAFVEKDVERLNQLEFSPRQLEFLSTKASVVRRLLEMAGE